MKKKIYAMVLSLTLALSLAACGSPEVSGPVDREPITSTDNQTSVGSQTEESSAEESSSEATPSGAYASLEDWMNSDEQKLVVDTVNSQLESAGISIDFYAEGNVMVMDYTYTEQQDLDGMSQDEITSVFDEQVAPTFSGMVASLFDSFESEYGLVLDDIKLIFRNADGTELYSKNFSEL